ncbi:hypothetical protein YC2023_108586 [Brassica napus]
MTSVGVRQHTQDVRVCSSAHTGRPGLSVFVCMCPSAHTGRSWLSISAHISTLTLPVDCLGDFNPRGLSGQYTQDGRGYPPAHTAHPWLSVCVHVCSSVSVSKHRTSVAVHQYTYQHYTQDVCGSPPAHTARLWLSVSTHRTSVAIRVCLWVSTSTHRTFVAVCGCPSAHTGRLCVSVSTHRTSVCVHVCLIRAHRTSVAVHQYTYQHAGTHMTSVGVRQHTQDVRVYPSAHTGHLGLSVCVRVCPSAHTGRTWLSISTHINTLVLGLSTLTLPTDCSDDFGPRGLCVQYTQDVRWCLPAHTVLPWLSLCVRVCPSAHKGRPWLSISTHISTLVLGVSTLALPVDCLDDFGPHGLSVQYTQDVRGCPPAHTGRLWVSVSTHISTTRRSSVGVRQHTQDVRVCPSAHKGRLCVSISTHRTFGAVRVCLCVSVSTHRRSVAVHHTHRTSVGVRQHIQDIRGCPCVSMCVRLCPSAHIGHPWLSISTHISTLVLGLSTLALPVDCLGDFGPRGLSVQYTQDVRGCPPADTECLWLSVSTHKTSVAVRVCLWVSASTHRTFVAVRGCPLAHTGRPCVSVSTHRTSVCVHVCPSAHTGRPWLSISTHISTLALAVDYLGDFGPCGLSFQYTQDIRGCPPAHTGCPWVSVSTYISMLVLGLCTLTLPVDCSGDFGPRGLSVQYTQDVHGCPSAHTGRPCVSVSTHRTSVFGRQHTQDVCGCPSVHISARCTHRTSVGVRQHTQDNRGSPCVSVCVRLCPSAYIGHPPTWVSACAHTTSVAVRGCPSAHIGRQWLSVCVRVCLWVSASTHRTFVAVRQHTQDVRDFSCVSVCVRQHTQDVRGYPSVHISAHCTHITSVGVRQHTQDVRVCSSAHTGRLGLSVFVCVCPLAHTGRSWLSISAHISTLVLGLCTLTLPVDCLGDFGPRGLSGQYTQDGRGCPPAHTAHPWLSVCVHVCSSVSVSKHRTSVAVHHTHGTSVGVRQHTQDVRVCSSAHTGRLGLSVFVCVCPLAHTGRSWLSISTHINTLVLGLSTLTLPADCSDDFGPRGLCVQYTQDVRGCLPAHTVLPWLSVCVRVCPSVSVSTQRMSVAVHHYTYQHVVHTGRPWVSASTHRMSVGVRQYTYQHVGSWTQHAHPSRGLFGLSVGVHQYTYQHVGPWTQHADPSRGLFGTSVCVRQHTQDVRVCPSAHTGRLWLSISTHISTLVLGLSTLTLPVNCSGDFGPRGLSGQYTQDVRGCPPAHTGHPWLSVCVRLCPSAHIGHPPTWAVCSVHTGHSWVSASAHSTSVAVRGCPSAHIGRQWLSVCVRVCLWVSASTHRTFVAVRQHTQDVRDFSCVSVCVRQHTQDVRRCPSVHISAHCTHMTSVSVRQHTQDVRVCSSAHTGHLGLSVFVCVCPLAHTGRSWLSISAHISTLVLGLSTLTLPVDCLGDFGPRGLSGQYTQDGRGCPPAHTSHPWLSVCVHVCSSVSVSKHRTSVDVHQYTYQHVVHIGRPWESTSTHSTSVAVRGCPSAHTGHPWLSVCVCGCPPAHRTFVAVCGCPSAHTGRPCVSVSTDRTSVCVHVCHSAHTGRSWLSISTHINTLVLGLSTLSIPLDCLGDFGPPGLSVRYKHDVCGCSSAHTGRLGLSVFVCVFPLAHTGCSWLSISTHINTLVLGHSTLTLPADCSDDFGPCGLCVQYTQDVRGCLPAHTVLPWLSVCVRVCPSVSVSTQRMSVAVHQYTYQHVVHTGRPWVSASTHRMSVGVRQYTYQHVGSWTQHAHPSRGLFGTSVCVRQHTQDVRVCPSAHIGRSGLSVCVCVCPSAHTGGLWRSISTHISTLVLGLSTLTLPVNCSGDFGPRGLSGQYTQDVRGCPPAHTGHPWLSVCVRVCSSVFVSTHRTSVAVHQYTYQHVGPWTLHAGPSRGLFG